MFKREFVLRHIKVLPLLLLLAVSSNSHGIGLGSVPANGVLNQPLNIEIPVISNDYQLYDLKVSLANRQRHELVDITYPSWLPKLKFALKTSVEGSVLQVTTRQPLKEPVVSFVLKVEYQGGTFYKEVTLLLDPAEVGQVVPQQFVQTTRQAAQPPTRVERQQPTNTAAPVKFERAKAETNASVNTAAPVERVATSASNDSVVVQSGQSLWRIAKSWKVESASLNKRMEAIFTANPHAFISGDRNKLIVGATLALDSNFISYTKQPVRREPDISVATTNNNSSLVNSQRLPATSRTIVSSNAGSTDSKTVLKARIAQLNQTVMQQRLINEQLKRDMDRLEQILQKLSKQPTIASTSNQVITSAEANRPNTVTTPPVKIASETNTDSKNATTKQSVASTETRKIKPNEAPNRNTDTSTIVPIKESIENTNDEFNKYWRIGLWLGFGFLMFIFASTIFSKRIGKIKAKRFTKQLNKRLKDIDKLMDGNETVDKFAVPDSLSSNAQIKCLRSAAEFYCRCNRFGLAKELVNESLIQFSGNRKIVRALLEIRDEVRAKLDESMQSGIVEKLSTGNFPKPGFVLEAVKDEDELKAFNDEFVKEWTNKVSSL